MVCRCPDLYFVASHHHRRRGVVLVFREKHEKFSSTETLGEWRSHLDAILALDSAEVLLTDFGKHLVKHDDKTLFDFRPYLTKITQEVEESGLSWTKITQEVEERVGYLGHALPDQELEETSFNDDDDT